MLKRLFSVIILTFALILFLPQKINAVFLLTGSNSISNISGTTLPITDLQIGGTGSEPIPVKLRVTNGTLSIGNTSGLTFTGSSSGSTIYFRGSLTNINNALNTVKYSRSGSGSDTLEVSLVEYGEVFFVGNNHLYKFITVSGGITANNAVSNAESQHAYDATGYLATITSQAENDFVAARLQGDGWIGASDSESEGKWKWIAGPEVGTLFTSGNSPNSIGVSGNYSNWATGEPNDYGTGEDCAQFYITSSKWNDLPCTGSTLSGYVVEFGRDGDMPTVVAKNISINTLAVYTLTYNHDSYGTVSGNTSQNVAAGFSGTSVTAVPSTGYHFVNWSDNSTSNPRVDTNVSHNINVTANFAIDTFTITFVAGPHGFISGNTSQTINYGGNSTSVTAVGDTGYHFVNWSDGNGQNPREIFGIVENKTLTANFIADDVNAPIISSVGSTIFSNQAFISWVTDENSSSQVQYGLNQNYGFITSESDVSTRITNHLVQLNDLKSCARYYYRVISSDSTNNQSASDQKTFNTLGCPVSTIITGTESTLPTTGGTVQLINNLSTAKIEVSSDYATQSATFQINKLDSSQIPLMPNNKIIANDNFYDLTAVTSDNQQLTSFDNPIVFTVFYGSDTETNFDESTLDIYKFDGTNWIKKNCLLDTTANTLTCNLNGFSTYALLGNSKDNPVSDYSSLNFSSSPSNCNNSPPVLTPDLFQINTTNNSAKLFFTPIDVDQFYISFSNNQNAEEYGELVSLAREGVQSETIFLLKPNTIYYVKVRGQNGCMPGNWSNIMEFTTDSSIYYKYSPLTKNVHQSSVVVKPIITPESTKYEPSPSPSVIKTEISSSKPKNKKCFLWWCW